uniref:RRM domain-containing protein n=1 Tax=Glossina brevipalpis TaxID=37001 RepID=A0A1A9WV24_9MUSC
MTASGASAAVARICVVGLLADTTTCDRHVASHLFIPAWLGSNPEIQRYGNVSLLLSSSKDVLHKICNPHGQVLRIVIFKKNGVQAMVEFDSLDAATRARENLNGADIYSGCCTLKIDFAKPEKLNVYKNEPDTSWDYTLTTAFGNSDQQLENIGIDKG